VESEVAPIGLALAERDGERATIERWLAAARDGSGGVLAVEGPAGIGKTALLAAAREAAAARGMRVLRARGAELELDFPFGVVRQLFEPALAAAGPAEHAALLGGAAGIAARLLALPGADAGAEPSADPSFAVLHGLYWLCANLAAERPLLVVVDDAHWADTPSLRYLAFLSPRLEELPVALLLGARPREPAPGLELLATLTTDPATRRVTPAPLGAASVGRMLAAGLGADPEPAFTAACHRATGGNPFLVGQLVAGLAEEGTAPTAGAVTRIETLGARWAARWILLRLARLHAAAAPLARALAILERGELADAAALAQLDGAAAVAGADALAGAGILAPGRPLAFAHPIVRAGVYGEIGQAERAAGHRRAARLLADAGAAEERVAEHLLAADPVGDAWVVERLVAAARAAGRSGAPELAAVYLRRALEEPPEPAARAALLLELGIAEDNAGQAAARPHMRAAIDAAADPEARLTAAVVLGHALGRDNRFAEALDVLDAAIAAGPRPDSPAMLAAEALAASVATFSVATAGANARRIRAARERVERAGEPTREQLALAGQLAVRANEPAERAAALALRALATAGGARPEPTDLPWFHQCAVTLLWSERYGELASLLDDAVAGARARGDAALFTGALAYRGWLALRRGDPRAAEADARTAIEADALPAPRMYRARSAAVLVHALSQQARLGEAEYALGPIAADIEAESTIAAPLRVARGTLRLEQLRPAEALEDFLAAGAIAGRTGLISPGCLPWRSAAALARLALGDEQGAAALAADELALARDFGAPRALGVALRAVGLTTGDEAALRESATVLEDADARVELARSLTALGGALRRANRRLEARELLGRARDLAHRVGALAPAAAAETELRATGAKPRRIMLTGLDSLTASERRVAELAAEGLTNREIAQALFVTMRTVEGHLTHVFQKLDLRSRDQLPDVFATG
jgi:DNA-binding CsgD family transcriptional regulator